MDFCISFNNVTDTLRTEDAAKGVFDGEVIEIPAFMSAGCGLAYLVRNSERDTIEKFLCDKKIAYENIAKVKKENNRYVSD